MFLHLGEDKVIYNKDIIGIFDIENTSVSKLTKAFLSEKGRNFITVSYEMPKAFIVCSDENQNETVYISQISSATLKKRSNIY